MFNNNIFGNKKITTEEITVTKIIEPPSETDSTSTEGNLRYNYATKKYQFYNGTIWATFDISGPPSNLWEIINATYIKPLDAYSGGLRVSNITSYSSGGTSNLTLNSQSGIVSIMSNSKIAGLWANSLYSTSSWISIVAGNDYLTPNLVVMGSDQSAHQNAVIGAHTSTLGGWAPLFINRHEGLSSLFSGGNIHMGVGTTTTYNYGDFNNAGISYCNTLKSYSATLPDVALDLYGKGTEGIQIHGKLKTNTIGSFDSGTLISTDQINTPSIRGEGALGASSWINSAFSITGGDAVGIGTDPNGTALIGGHTNALNGWKGININRYVAGISASGGDVYISHVGATTYMYSPLIVDTIRGLTDLTSGTIFGITVDKSSINALSLNTINAYDVVADDKDITLNPKGVGVVKINASLNVNTIATYGTNQKLNLLPNGSGEVVIGGDLNVNTITTKSGAGGMTFNTSGTNAFIFNAVSLSDQVTMKVYNGTNSISAFQIGKGDGNCTGLGYDYTLQKAYMGVAVSGAWQQSLSMTQTTVTIDASVLKAAWVQGTTGNLTLATTTTDIICAGGLYPPAYNVHATRAAGGMLVYDGSAKVMKYHNGTAWQTLLYAPSAYMNATFSTFSIGSVNTSILRPPSGGVVKATGLNIQYSDVEEPWTLSSDLGGLYTWNNHREKVYIVEDREMVDKIEKKEFIDEIKEKPIKEKNDINIQNLYVDKINPRGKEMFIVNGMKIGECKSEEPGSIGYDDMGMFCITKHKMKYYFAGNEPAKNKYEMSDKGFNYCHDRFVQYNNAIHELGEKLIKMQGLVDELSKKILSNKIDDKIQSLESQGGLGNSLIFS